MKKLFVFIMKFSVFGRRENQKIRRPIVCFDFIYMVDMLKRFESSAYNFFSNKSMLKNVTHAISVRVLWRQLVKVISVPIFFLSYSTTPQRMISTMFKLTRIRSFEQFNSPRRKLNAFIQLPELAHSFGKFWIGIKTFLGTKFHSIEMSFTHSRSGKMFFARRTFFVHALILLLISFYYTTNSYSSDQWLKDTPIGTESSGTIDDLMRVNQEAQDRLLNGLRRGIVLVPATANTLTVLVGEISIPNSAVSVVQYRETTSDTTITWSDIDTGAEASATQYYVYATADTDITGMVFKISASSSSPSGSTYYRKIGYFYNDSGGSIVDVGNIKDSDAPNKISVTGTSDISTSSTSLVDMTDMAIRGVTSGRPVTLTFSAPISDDTGTPALDATLAFDMDGVTQRSYFVGSLGSVSTGQKLRGNADPSVLIYPSAGAHTFKVQWKTSAGTVNQDGSTHSNRIMTLEEL